MRLGTDGAAAIKVGGDIVKSPVGALDKLPKAPHAKASSNGANKAMKRRNPTLQRDSPNIKKNFLNFVGWCWSIIFRFLHSSRCSGYFSNFETFPNFLHEGIESCHVLNQLIQFMPFQISGIFLSIPIQLFSEVTTLSSIS